MHKRRPVLTYRVINYPLLGLFGYALNINIASIWVNFGYTVKLK